MGQNNENELWIGHRISISIQSDISLSIRRPDDISQCNVYCHLLCSGRSSFNNVDFKGPLLSERYVIFGLISADLHSYRKIEAKWNWNVIRDWTIAKKIGIFGRFVWLSNREWQMRFVADVFLEIINGTIYNGLIHFFENEWKKNSSGRCQQTQFMVKLSTFIWWI